MILNVLHYLKVNVINNLLSRFLSSENTNEDHVMRRGKTHSIFGSVREKKSKIKYKSLIKLV